MQKFFFAIQMLENAHYKNEISKIGHFFFSMNATIYGRWFGLGVKMTELKSTEPFQFLELFIYIYFEMVSAVCNKLFNW